MTAYLDEIKEQRDIARIARDAALEANETLVVRKDALEQRVRSLEALIREAIPVIDDDDLCFLHPQDWLDSARALLEAKEPGS